MAKEIERKFLVKSTAYRAEAISVKSIEQGYLNRDPDRTVRVRIIDTQAFLTVKTRNQGLMRDEWEYPIPVSDARRILDTACIGMIVKRRCLIPADNGLMWEVDEFVKPEMSAIAEIELPSEDCSVELPDWVGSEVTGDERYYNSNIGV